ncbi:MAG: hypothetical protein IJ961_00110 [Bacteroidales bacterium]|nr:hypothetical protein [Bacteroidales bacterium]
MKRISILLFSVLFSITAANAQGKSIKDFIDSHKKFRKQAESFADKYEWVSFKYKNIHYYDDNFSWEDEFEVIIKYDGKNSLVFYNINGIEWIYLLDRNYYQKIEQLEGSLIKYENTIFDFSRRYEELGKHGFIPRYFIHIPYYLYPIDLAYSASITRIFTDVEDIEIKGELYNVYKFDDQEESLRLYVNAATNVMDSAYQEERNYLSKDYYTFYDFSYENRQHYIDSVFNYNNKEYEKYSRYDVSNPEPYYSLDTIVTDKLLDFPIVNLKNDTTTLREQDSWVLLYFWRYEDSNIEQLERYVHEKNSLGYIIPENEDVRIMAIEPSSNNMEYIQRVADKYDCEDIIYSAKEIYNAIDVLYNKYYLISPDKKVVYKSSTLGDYGEAVEN